MKTLFSFFLIFCVAFINKSYVHDSEDDLIDLPPVTLVTYQNDMNTIHNDNCTSCHNNPLINASPTSLLTYDPVKKAVNNRDLLNRISSEDSDFLMPFQGLRLSQSTINVILQWNTDGLLEQQITSS